MKNFAFRHQKNQKLICILDCANGFTKTWQLNQEAKLDGKIMTLNSSLMHSTSSVVLRYFWQNAIRIDKNL